MKRLGELNTLLLEAMKQILGSLEVPKQNKERQNKTPETEQKRQNNHAM